MVLEFEGEVIYWRGPAPFYFVRIPEEESRQIKEVEKFVTYGWGCIPVQARIGSTDFRTSLIPKDGRFLLPIRVVVRRALVIQEGDVVTANVVLGSP